MSASRKSPSNNETRVPWQDKDTPRLLLRADGIKDQQAWVKRISSSTCLCPIPKTSPLDSDFAE